MLFKGVKRVKCLIQILLVFCGVFGGAVPAAWSAFGFIRPVTISLQPSLPGKPQTHINSLACHDAADGKPLNCPFTVKLLGLREPVDLSENNGGHLHGYDTHPLIEPANGALQFGGDLDPSKLGVSGKTRKIEAEITHRLPFAAGLIIQDLVIEAPPGYACFSGCFTATQYKYLYTLNVGVKGLVPFPESSDTHIVIRGGKAEHPEGTWGTLDTVIRLLTVSQEYFEITDRRLSVNDLSLPQGGLFDLNNQWNTAKGGHEEHRTGADADLNRADMREGQRLTVWMMTN